MMKLIFMFFITILCVSTGIETPTSARYGTGLMLSGTNRCDADRVFEDVVCGCFIAFANGVDSRELREKCRDVTTIAVRDAQTYCNRYLTNQTYNTDRVQRRVRAVKNKCIVPDTTVHNAVVRSLDEHEIIDRLDEILDLAEHLCEALEEISAH